MGKLSVDIHLTPSVDIHLACTCICVYVHADLRYVKRCDDFFFLVFFVMYSVSRDGDIYDVLSVSALGPNRK